MLIWCWDDIEAFAVAGGGFVVCEVRKLIRLESALKRLVSVFVECTITRLGRPGLMRCGFR